MNSKNQDWKSKTWNTQVQALCSELQTADKLLTRFLIPSGSVLLAGWDFFFNLRCDFIASWDTSTLLGWQNYSIPEDSYQILGIHVLRPHHAHWLLTPLTTCSFGGHWYLICNILPMMAIDATWSKHSPPMRTSLKPTLNNGARRRIHSNFTATVEWPQLRSVGILSMMCRRGNADKSSLG